MHTLHKITNLGPIRPRRPEGASRTGAAARRGQAADALPRTHCPKTQAGGGDPAHKQRQEELWRVELCLSVRRKNWSGRAVPVRVCGDRRGCVRHRAAENLENLCIPTVPPLPPSKHSANPGLETTPVTGPGTPATGGKAEEELC